MNTDKHEEKMNQLARSMGIQLSDILVDEINEFCKKNYHMKNHLLTQMIVNSSMGILKSSMVNLMFALKKEAQEKEYQLFMENFKKDIFEAVKGLESEQEELQP